MSTRTVKPELVKTLRDWSKRWPGTSNLGFDPETREPAIFSIGAERKQVSRIPWVREGDTLTILSTPTRFSEAAVTAATARYNKIGEQRKAYEMAAADQIRTAEAELLDAWRAYRNPGGRSIDALRRDILTAERNIRQVEDALAAQIYKDREHVKYGEGSSIYMPPMPVARRGVPLVSVSL